MEKLSIVTPKQLTWSQTSDRKFELRGNEKVYAMIKWEKSSGSLATGETAHGKWTFKREGFFKPFITVRVSGTEPNIAYLKPGPKNESKLDIIGKQIFLCKPGKTKSKEMGFFDVSGQMVVRITKKSHFNSYLTNIGNEPVKHNPEELSILLLMGCYLNVLHRGDEELAAIIAATNTLTLNPG